MRDLLVSKGSCAYVSRLSSLLLSEMKGFGLGRGGASFHLALGFVFFLGPGEETQDGPLTMESVEAQRLGACQGLARDALDRIPGMCPNQSTALSLIGLASSSTSLRRPLFVASIMNDELQWRHGP